MDVEAGSEDSKERCASEDLVVKKKKKQEENEEQPCMDKVTEEQDKQRHVKAYKARKRWLLLANRLRNCKEVRDVSKDGEVKFLVFEAFPTKSTKTGCWYRVKFPGEDLELFVHIYSTSAITTLDDLAGFNNTGNVRVWPSEECLAYYLWNHKELIRSKSVLELGAGMVGLSGLTAAASGAGEVLLTDGNQKAVENLQRIIEANRTNGYMSCRQFSWNDTLQGKQFDVILCADCVFFVEEQQNLLDCTYRHLKPGGTVYFMAPDRASTVTSFRHIIDMQLERWKSVHFDDRNHIDSITSHLGYQETLNAVHHSCMLIQDEVVEELEKKGQKMEFDKEVVAQVAYTVCDTLCNTWPDELLQFAKHARRSVVNISDLKLLFRRNESMLSLTEKIAGSSLLPARQRQPRKGTTRKNNETCKIERIDSEDSRDTNSSVPESRSTMKLTDFWDQPSTSRGPVPQLPQGSSSCASEATRDKSNPISGSLQRKKITMEKATSSPLVTETRAASGSRKAENGRKNRQGQVIKQSRQPAHPNVSKSRENQELEIMDVDIPTFPKEDDSHKQEEHTASVSFSVDGREKCRKNVDAPKSTEIRSKMVDVKTSKSSTSTSKISDDAVHVGHSTIAKNCEKRWDEIRGNDEDNNIEAEFHVERSSKPISTAKAPVVNSLKRTVEKQNSVTVSRKRPSIADDCFSAFKFESDDEEPTETIRSLVENKGETTKTVSLSPSRSGSKRSAPGETASSNVLEEQQQKIGSDESDIDLDATVFDF